MTFVQLTGKEFCCYPQFTLRLRKRGLVWIGGENNDTISASSNGSGKTTLFKALGWAAYGKSVDGKDGDEVIRAGQKCAQTTLELTDGWTVVRERRKAQPKLFLLKGGKEQEGSPKELQERIDRLIGQDWQTFRNVTLYGQRDNRRFVHPDTSDKERKELLGRILNTTVYGVAHKWAREESLKLQKAIDALNVDVSKAVARLEEYDLEELNTQRGAWEESRKRRANSEKAFAAKFIDDAKELRKEAGDIEALRRRLSELQTTQDGIKALEEAAEAAAVVQTEAAKRESAAREACSEAFATLQAAERQRAKLETEDGLCPLCSGDMATGGAAEHIAELDAQVAKDKKAHTKAMTAVEKADEQTTAAQTDLKAKLAKLRAARTEAEEIPDVQRELGEAERLSDRIESKKESAKKSLELVKEILAEVNPIDEQITRAEERIKTATALRDKAKKELVSTTHQRAHYEFWTKGFSPAGCPSFALDSVMPTLTERANHYLATLADGDIVVNFSTQKELKSAKGEYRDEISMDWEIEGVANQEPSGGQWKKLEIAANFALMDLVSAQEGARSDILLLDEVFDGLDAEGVDRVGQLLQKLRSDRSTIMVISHAATMQEWFERALVVRKRGGASELDVA